MGGGKMEEEENHEVNFVEDKDLSKLKELTDEELVAACGGRTAHKGSRHGDKMTAKLDRIAEAEREYMEKYNKKTLETKLKSSKKCKDEEAVKNSIDVTELPSEIKVKKKKKKRSKDEIEE